MSKLKDKLKKKETFDTADIKPLSEKETRELTRGMILEWFKNHRWGKLKALQEEIIEKTTGEKIDLRDKIIENASKKLDKLEKKNKELEVSKKETLAGVEKFADEIIGIDDNPKTLINVLNKHQAEQMSEERFFATLDTHVGREKNSKFLKKLIQNNKHIAGLLKALKESNPKAIHDVELAINQGDYDQLKTALTKGTSISKKQVDYFFGVAMTTEMGKKEYLGNKTVDGWINSVMKARYIGHTFAMKEAAKHADVSIYLVMKFGMQSMASLRAMDSNLQNHKNLIENKEKVGAKDRERIAFIDEIHKMREAFDKKLKDKGLESRFHEILDSYLKTQTKLSAQQQADIKSSAKFEDLKMFQIFDLIYADDKDRSRLMYHGITRGIALGRQYYTLLKDENYRLKKALLGYHWQRAKNMAIWEFRSKADSWKMKDILSDIESLEKRMKKGRTQVGSLLDNAKDYNIDLNGKHVSADELYDHDMIMKKFHILSNKASQIMTAKAKPVISAGKVLDNGMRQFGKEFENMSAQQLLHNDKQTLKALGLGGKTAQELEKITGKQLIGIYGNQLVDLKTMQDVTRARFSGLAEVIDENVNQPFQKKLAGQMADADELKFRRQTTGKLEDMHKPSKYKKWGKRLILPSIVVGLQVPLLYSGKAKNSEVMWNIAEAGLGFVPVIGTGLDFKAAFWGNSLAGKELNMKERALSFGFGCIGLVADITTVIGGAGLGLRAVIGGMKGTRGALHAAKAARAAGDVRDLARAGHIAELGWFGKAAAKVSGTFNKAEKLEKATEATVKAKALKEAAILHDLENALGGKKLNPEKLGEELELIKYAHADNPKVMNQIKKLESLREGLAPGQSYMKMLEGAVKVPTHELISIKGFLSRTGMKIKSAFLEVKASLLKIGVPADAIREYEKSFDTIKDLEKLHAEKWGDIKNLAAKKELAEKELRALQELKVGATKEQEAFLKLLEKERKLTRKRTIAEAERKALQTEHVALKPAYQLVEKYGSISKTPRKELEQLLAEAGRHGHKIDFNEFSKNFTKLQDSKREISKLTKDLKGVGKKKDSLDSKLAAENAEWHKKVTDTNNLVKDVDGKMEVAQNELKNLNSQINNVSSKRFAIHQRIEMKAEGWIARSDNMRRVSRYMQYGGVAMGGIWFLSNWKADPVTQLSYAAKGIDYATTGAGKALHTIYIENHAGKDALDKLIADKVDALKRKKKIQGIIADSEKRGRSKIEVLAENADDPGAQEIIRAEGLQGKILAFKEKAGGKLRAAKREIATGDAANKLREKISG